MRLLLTVVLACALSTGCGDPALAPAAYLDYPDAGAPVMDAGFCCADELWRNNLTVFCNTLPVEVREWDDRYTSDPEGNEADGGSCITYQFDRAASRTLCPDTLWRCPEPLPLPDGNRFY